MAQVKSAVLGIRWFMLGLFGITISVNAWGVSIETQRSRFLQAEKTIHKVPLNEAKRMVDALDGYPLQPYLQLELLSRTLDDTAAVQAFLQTHKDSVLAWPLKKRWLLHLASNRLGQPYLQHYRMGTDTVLDCYALELRLLQEPAKQVWPDVANIWAVGESRPKECDSLFKRWQQAGQRSQDVVWLRLVRAADGGDSSIIPYLRTLLPKQQQYLADKWLQVIKDPSQAARKNFFPLKHARERDILVFALKKMVWKSPDSAYKLWQRFAQDPKLSRAQRADVARQFFIAFASKDDPRAAAFLKQVPADLEDDLLLQWQLAWHLRHEDWQGVQQLYQRLPALMQNKDQWQYWQARALAASRKVEDANALYKIVAANRSFYGFMAAARIGQAPSLAHKPVPVSAEQLAAFKQSAPMRRSQEWLALGREQAARRELNWIQKHGPELQKLSAAKLAYQQGWYDRAIHALADAGYWDDVEMRFPMAFKQEIQKHAKAAKVDPAWAMAIARRESTFIPTATSGVGARGLMQIMPTTAKYITGRKVSIDALYNPNINIDYGTDYLRYLLQKNSSNLVVATAAYNAGFARVKSWIPTEAAQPVDIWIENIPFKETRDYVKAVLAYYQIYNVRMNQNNDIFVPLVTLEIGREAK